MTSLLAVSLARLPLLVALALLAFALNSSVALGAFTPRRLLVTDAAQSIVIDTYDSPRRANQLALFDAKFGASTMTVGDCLEACVVDGVIVSLHRGGNARVPSAGYCISGDGRAAAWMEANLAVGQRVAVGLAPGSTSGFTASRELDGVDSPPRPGGMFVYTPDGANARASSAIEGCYEVLVEDGVVSSVGGASSPIPKSGFVICAYGAGPARDWASANLEPGVRVRFAGSELTAVGDASRFTYRARAALRGLDNLLESSEPGRSPEVAAELLSRRADVASALAVSQRSLDLGDEEGAILAALDGCDLAAAAPSLVVPTRDVEFRGVWHRPVEVTREAIARTVDTLALANVNMLFLEVFYGGRTIYPSGLAPRNPAFAGSDLLSVWVEEAHRAGLELHAWVHTLRFTEQGPILSASPSWAAAYRSPELRTKGAPIVDTSVDFADPSNPAVRAFVVGLVGELAGAYSIDGIHLDYIRYGSGDDVPQGYSYSDWSRAAFRLEYGIDPSLITSQNPSVWREWKAWRRMQVTELVRSVRWNLLATRPHLALSAAVVGDIASAKNSKLQDWSAWVEEGLLDFVTPMLYHTEATWVQSATKKAADIAGVRASLISGIGAFLGLEPAILLQQAESTRAGGAQGTALFALHSLGGGQLRVLQEGLFRQAATVPYRGTGPVMVAVGTFAKNLEARLAVAPVGGPPAPPAMQASLTTASRLATELRSWLSSQPGSLPAAQSVSALLELLVRLQKSVSPGSDFSRQMEVLVKLCMVAKRWERLHGRGGV